MSPVLDKPPARTADQDVHSLDIDNLVDSKDPGRIQAMFDRIAGRYDLMNDMMTLGLHRRWKAKAIDLLQVQPGEHVLDVCTGTGDVAAMLARRGVTVTALDFSPQMLALAKKRFAPEKDPRYANISWLEGDAMALPCESNSFDGVITSFGLRNVASVPKALAEMREVLRPGRRLVILETGFGESPPVLAQLVRPALPLLRLLSAKPSAYRYLLESAQAFGKDLGMQLTAAGFITPETTTGLNGFPVSVSFAVKP